MKVYFKKQKPREVYYRDYKNFSNDNFRADLLNILMKGNIRISRLDVFVNTALQVLGQHAPIKRRSVRGNESPFMSKPLKKYIEEISLKK